MDIKEKEKHKSVFKSELNKFASKLEKYVSTDEGDWTDNDILIRMLKRGPENAGEVCLECHEFLHGKGLYQIPSNPFDAACLCLI